MFNLPVYYGGSVSWSDKIALLIQNFKTHKISSIDTEMYVYARTR